MRKTMRCCPCCRLPGTITAVHHGVFDGVAVLFALCLRCTRANARLPPSTLQKRLNACGELAASDTTCRFWTARFPDRDAATLAASMLGHESTARQMAEALNWL